MIYMVECGFSEPKLETEWNAEYSGPKLAALLQRVPGFIRSQRFCEVTRSAAPYIAVHEVVSASLFEGESYSGAGGGSFHHWQPYITNWRRTFFSGLHHLPEVSDTQRLIVLDEPPRTIEGMTVYWLKAAGLGDLVPSRGVVIVAALEAEAALRRAGGSARLFAPISRQMKQQD